MSKIKEIRKIESNIKEIKKEKVESLDDEVEDDFEDTSFVNVGGFRRSNRGSTIDSIEAPQEVNNSQTRPTREKEDEKEINFRVSYDGGGRPYENKTYTPVGSAETAGRQDNFGQRGLDDRNDLRRLQDNFGQNSNQGSAERAYEGEREFGQKKNRRNDF